jgi:hypothetical protein
MDEDDFKIFKNRAGASQVSSLNSNNASRHPSADSRDVQSVGQEVCSLCCKFGPRRLGCSAKYELHAERAAAAGIGGLANEAYSFAADEASSFASCLRPPSCRLFQAASLSRRSLACELT